MQVAVLLCALLTWSSAVATIAIDLNVLLQIPAELNCTVSASLSSDVGLTISDFLVKYGYTLESHEVTTEDGYILTVHRIPGGRNETAVPTTPKPAVLFAHCMGCSSMDWVWQGPNISLALLLADAGYDVWLANMRGNVHSMRHVSLTPADAEFWEFSYHEKGIYDMSATIDYVLNATTLTTISYVGHSQGTLTGLVLTTLKPEYNQKLNLMVLMSPAIYRGNIASPVGRFLTDFKPVWKPALSVLNVHSFPPSTTLNSIAAVVCNQYSILQNLCIGLLSLIGGYDIDQVDRATLPVYLSNTPSGMSVKEIDHLTQGVSSGSFRQFDYGVISNLFRYGSFTPPGYCICKVTAPLAVYYAKNDYLAAVVDVEQFLGELTATQTPVDQYLIENENFNHFDFFTAKDVKTLLYDRVIGVVQQKNPCT